MPAWRCRFYYGPCNGQVKSLFFASAPPQTTTCGGATYRREPTTEASTIAYVLESADVLYRPGAVSGERDVFRAWSRLQRAFNRTIPSAAHRVEHARARVRRARRR